MLDHELDIVAAGSRSPDETQRRAADPGSSVWVGASAGSGKTKVLTDRLLRLLLPREDGTAGTDPERILCLTFTKAAASEMALRLGRKLGQWAVADEGALAADLEKLLGRVPRGIEVEAARRLFAAVIDAPGRLKIMTIHSFCQSVLGRFPLEAGLPPHFNALDEGQAFALLCRARDEVLDQARREPDSPEGLALSRIATSQSEEAFAALLQDVVKESHQLQTLLEKHGGAEALYHAVYEALDLEPGSVEETLMHAACAQGSFDEAGLREACRIMAEHGTEKSDQPKADTIQNWLDADITVRVTGIHIFKQAFLKSDGEIRKNIATKKLSENNPAMAFCLQAEAERLYDLNDKLKATACALLTVDILTFGQAVLSRYRALKERRAALDFDDLINTTLSLLTRKDMAAWVMYKLDGGLDHILVDEAQDTNPEQWKIIRELCDDFFAGMGRREDITRTVFSVGDEKQSIYSFQRAAPEKFWEMRDYFAARVKDAGQQWRNEEMLFSFRSTPSVLRFVDEVFAPPEARKGLGLGLLEHESKRARAAGHVELWPLFESAGKSERSPWEVPFQPVSSRSGAARLADHIAATISDWLGQGTLLQSKGRPINPGDIMILVRRRTNFVNQLIRALKLANIPVSGVDRMVLKEQLPVQDLLAAAQFALLPADDLSLACFLKSPLVGWNDAQLEAVAAKRPKGQTLWQTLEEKLDDKKLLTWLGGLADLASRVDPYAFFSHLLQEPCPASEKSGLYAMTARLGAEALDPLDELLNAALTFGKDRVPTLQDFILYMTQGDSNIKREQEEAGGAVRIMTVHGAKGLQAPIVILPDTTRTSRTPPGSSHRLIWPDKSGLTVPLFSPRKDMDCQLYTRVLERLIDRQDEEYRRLFYVALTRAEDQLYVAGYTGRKKSYQDESWYNYAAAAMARLPERQEAHFTGEALAEPVSDGEEEADSEEIQTPMTLYIANPQTDPPRLDKKPDTAIGAVDPATIGWLYTAPPQEPEPSRPLMPSRPSDEEPGARSPLDHDNLYRFRRGVISHKLLQYLPDQVEEKWEEAAQSFVTRYGQDLPAAVCESIVAETMAVLKDPRCSALFGPNSQAEVPVTGMVGTKLVSGQIDRLVVTEDEVLIIDYKTNRPPPTAPGDIPALYRKQMQAYSDIVARIYPGKNIKAFLLWTDGPQLMALNS